MVRGRLELGQFDKNKLAPFGTLIVRRFITAKRVYPNSFIYLDRAYDRSLIQLSWWAPQKINITLKV